MVTTNRAQEINHLFISAVEKTKQLLSKTEASEEEVRRMSIQVLQDALNSLKPIIKYIDQPVHISTKTGTTMIRGVRLSKYLVLTRDAQLVNPFHGDSVENAQDHVENFTMTSCQAGHVIDVLGEIAAVFVKAVDKVDERRWVLASRAEKLDAAARLFEP